MAAKPTTARPEQGSREEYLVAALRQLERQTVSAERDRSWSAAVQSKTKAIAVRAELDQLRETARRQAMPPTVAEHRSEVLSEVRRLRVGATEAGSYVAADRLLRLEHEMLGRAEEARTEAEEQALLETETAALEQEIARLQGKLAH